MTKLCISFSLATRFIGTFGVTVSILMINILASDFLSAKEHDKFSATVETWAFFGLNWTFIVKKAQSYKQAEILLICVLTYAGCSLIANGLLSFASITKKPGLTLPWMCVQVINIIDQSIALAVNLCYTEFSRSRNKSSWYFPISATYLLLSVYFLRIVCAARKEWANSTSTDDNICISTITRSYDSSQGFNMPKSPSYISEQIFFMNSPKPMASSQC